MRNISQTHSSAKKHIPQRTCIACRQIRPKRELIRLVRTASGNVEVDLDRKKTGRGAYLCTARECWEIGLKGGQLERALRTTFSQDHREQLTKYGRELRGTTSGKDE